MREIMFKTDDIFIAEPLPTTGQGWGKASEWSVAPEDKPAWHDDAEKKRLYGIELAKGHSNPFMAACAVFGQDTSAPLWASRHWISDPLVIAAKDIYQKAIEDEAVLLDKNQLAAKLLKIAEEKNADNTRYIMDAKERLKAYEIYSKVMGFSDQINIDTSTKNIVEGGIKIIFVKPEDKQPKLVPNIKSEISNDEPLPISLKLVSNSR